MRSKPPRWAIRNCVEPEDDTDTIAASALRDKLAGCVARFADRRDDWSVFGFETATLVPPASGVGIGSINDVFELDHGIRPDQRRWVMPAPLVSTAHGFCDEERQRQLHEPHPALRDRRNLIIGRWPGCAARACVLLCRRCDRHVEVTHLLVMTIPQSPC
jgi:hypothetical protein